MFFVVAAPTQPEHPKHIKEIGVMEPNLYFGDSNQTYCNLTRIFPKPTIYAAHGFNLLSFIWLLYFIYGMGYVTLAGAFASYYWTRDKTMVPFFALVGSLGRCVLYVLS